MEILAETGTVASLVKNSFIKLPHIGFVICITKESVYFIICFELKSSLIILMRGEQEFYSTLKPSLALHTY